MFDFGVVLVEEFGEFCFILVGVEMVKSGVYIKFFKLVYKFLFSWGYFVLGDK